MDADVERIGREMDDSVILGISIPCGDAKYAVIGRASDPVTKCTTSFMDANGLTFVFIDIDSEQGRNLIDVAGFSKKDIPYVYSVKRLAVIHARSCPKTTREIL